MTLTPRVFICYHCVLRTQLEDNDGVRDDVPISVAVATCNNMFWVMITCRVLAHLVVGAVVKWSERYLTIDFGSILLDFVEQMTMAAVPDS